MSNLKNLNLLGITLIGILFLMSMSCICASDASNSTVEGNNILGVGHDNIADVKNTQDYLDLKDDIEMLHPGDTYNLTRNYSFEKWDSRVKFNTGINIFSDNITINGNGYTIDGNEVSSIFNIQGNNVKIKDLNIVNGYSPIKTNSPIVWQGDNGIFSNSTIKDSSAPIGGAVKWTGNNGLIDDVAFINCSSKYLGGALYIGGSNNIINAICLNCTSSWSGDAIYVDRNRKNCTINSYHDNDHFFFIDGNYTNIDVYKYIDLHYVYPVMENLVDLMPILYRTFTYGGVNNLDGKTLYSGWYVNASEFVLTFTRNYDNNVTYQKNLYFHDINTTDDIFWKLYTGKFDYDHRFVKEITITNISDYEATCKLLTDENIFSSEINTLFGQSDSAIKALNINFAGKYNFKSNSMWDLNNKNIDVVNIKGNGSTISGTSEDSDTYKWASISADKYLSLSNLHIKGFNTAIENLGGTCILNNAIISDNKMDYTFSRDWGAGILNSGRCFCNNCTFSNNYAKNGGAIFNQGEVILYNTTFKGNTAYNNDKKVDHKGNDICVGDGGKVQIDGENITSNTDHVFFAKSISSTQETITTIVTIAGAFIAGVAVGIISFNPVMGFAAGAVVGAGIGAIGAGLIISSHFDVNFNRMKTCVILIGCSAVSGGLGGLAGYYATAAGASSAQTASSQQIAGAGANAGANVGGAAGGAAGQNAGLSMSQGPHVQHVVHLASGNGASTSCWSKCIVLLV